MNYSFYREIINEQLQDDKDPLSRKYYRYHSNKKGKAEGVNDKIKSAGVGDWFEQKLHKLSFLELQRSLFLDKSQIQKTFGDVTVDKNNFPDDNILEFEDGNLPKHLTQEQLNYIQEISLELEQNYLNNGLSKEEAELRQKTYGPNSLPEKKENSWNNIIFRGNYFNILFIIMDSCCPKFFSLWIITCRKK